MGDSEALVAQTSIASDHSAVDYNDASMKAASDTDASAIETSGDLAAPTMLSTAVDLVNSDVSISEPDSAAYASNTNAGDVAVVNYAQQEIPNVMAYDTNLSVDPSQSGAYESSLNGNSISETGNVTAVAITENGISHPGVIESAALHQPVDDSGTNLYHYKTFIS